MKVALILLLAANVDTHRADRRVTYLAQALQAVRETEREQLDRATEYARVLDRGACSSATIRLKVECLMTAAQKYCRNKKAADARRCPIYMDVAVSNILADRQLIPTERRYELMRRFRDPRKELAREVRQTQGALAVDFRLRMGERADENDDVLAKNIDRYCVQTADTTSLAWQACASSLVWFIGTRQTPARNAGPLTEGQGGSR